MSTSPPTPCHTVRVLLVDDEDGFAFADSVRALHPTVPVVMVTSYRTETIEAQGALGPFLSLLPKPLDYDDIHELVHALGSERAR